MINIKPFFKRILVKESSLSNAALVIFVAYVTSSLFGLVKNRVLAGVFGDSVELGIYYLADKLPSFVFSTFILTIITTSFIPIYTEIKNRSRKDADDFSSNIITLSVFFYFLVSIIVFIFSKPLAQIISWGSLDETSLSLMSNLMKIITLTQFSLILSGYLSSYLNSYRRFILPALVPIIYNLGVILGTLLFAKDYGIYGPAIGMFIGSVLAVIIQIPLLVYLGYHFVLKLNFVNSDTVRALKVSYPRMLAALSQRLYILAIGGFISKTYFSPSYLVVYEFANHLQNMPVQAFGVSLSQALLPTLSYEAVEKRSENVRKLLGKYIMIMSYFMFPVIIMFFVLRIPLVRILFGGDRFSWLGTNLTAYTLAFFSISMWFQSFSMVISRLFYAYKDTKTPTIINVVSMLVSFLFWFVFAVYLSLGVWSLALAFSLGALLNAVLLYMYTRKIIGDVFSGQYLNYLKISYATIITGTVTYAILKFLDRLVFDTTRTIPLIMLTFIIIVIGGLVYLSITDIFGVRYFRVYLKRVYNKIFN